MATHCTEGIGTVAPVYDLRGALKGETILIVAPGPSLDEFPVMALKGLRTLVLNSAVELTPEPWVWMYADKRFTRLYKQHLIEGYPPRILIARHELGVRKYFGGEQIWWYTWQRPIPRLPRRRRRGVWWGDPVNNFLPGHCSVLSNALSFCAILEVEHVILIGIDFETRDDQYYAAGVTKNQGPTGRERALRSGFNWFVAARKKRFWRALRLSTTSQVLAEKAHLDSVSTEEAIANASRLR